MLFLILFIIISNQSKQQNELEFSGESFAHLLSVGKAFYLSSASESSISNSFVKRTDTTLNTTKKKTTSRKTN